MPFQGKKQDEKRWNGSAYAPPHVMEDEDRAAGSVEYTSAPPPLSDTNREPDNTKTASGDDQSASYKAGAGSGLGNWASGSGDPDEQEAPPVSLYDKYMRDIANINTPYDWDVVNERLRADAYRGKQDAPYETLIDILNMRKDKYENIVPIDTFLQSVDPASDQQELLAKDDDRDIMETADVQEEDVTPGNLFMTVMTPEQLASLVDINSEVLGMLTEEQKQRINDGENPFLILGELDIDRQDEIERLSQTVLASLNNQQKTDLMFLGSGMLQGIDLETRQAILQHLKEDNGAITYDDLVDMGVYAPGTLAEGGFRRWLQNLDYGGPAHFGDLVSEEYHLNNFGTSFAHLDQEARLQRGAEMTMLLAMTAAPLIDYLAYGPSMESLNGANYGNNRLDNREQSGTAEGFKGSQAPYKPPEGAKETQWFYPDGKPKWPANNGFDGMQIGTSLQPGKRIDRFGDMDGTFVAPEGTPYGARSLPPGSEKKPYGVYEVVEPIDNVLGGRAVSWFDQPGGGPQYQLNMSLQELYDLGYIKILEP